MRRRMTITSPPSPSPERRGEKNIANSFVEDPACGESRRSARGGGLGGSAPMVRRRRCGFVFAFYLLPFGEEAHPLVATRRHWCAGGAWAFISVTGILYLL